MYPPQRAGVRATTIHDLVPLRHPDWVHPQTYRMHSRKYEHAAKTCDLIVVNSEFTAGEVVQLLDFPRERICVAHPGVGPIFKPDGARRDLGGPYLLTVATLERRKNLGTLLQAMPLIKEQNPDFRLAVVGAPGWQAPSLDVEGVLPLGYVDDEELAALYRGAEVFVYPSRFEGFGMPIVEAWRPGLRSSPRPIRPWTRRAARRQCAPIPTARQPSPLESNGRSSKETCSSLGGTSMRAASPPSPRVRRSCGPTLRKPLSLSAASYAGRTATHTTALAAAARSSTGVGSAVKSGTPRRPLSSGR